MEPHRAKIVDNAINVKEITLPQSVLVEEIVNSLEEGFTIAEIAVVLDRIYSGMSGSNPASDVASTGDAALSWVRMHLGDLDLNNTNS